MSSELPTNWEQRVLQLKEIVAAVFEAEHWTEIGLITGCVDLIERHPRLLRSLHWSDPDYAGHVLSVLLNLVRSEPENLSKIEGYVEHHGWSGGEYISSEPALGRKITFSPTVFSVPDGEVDESLVSVMMPFVPELLPVFDVIVECAAQSGLRCLRGDDIWEHSTVIQDVFTLIFRSRIVVCDFSGRNANVFYEAGIAHALGKHVVPIAQSESDIPFDIKHHRYLKYLNNEEGRAELANRLSARLKHLRGEEGIL